MRRSLHIACVLALLQVACIFAQRPDRAAERAAARAARRASKGNETALEKWNRLSPAERQRALATMPPERRRRLQQKLQQYRNLPAQEKQQLQDRYQAFSQLPPDQQNHARAVFRQFNSLPEDRRPMVRKEFEELRSMRPAEQAAHMNTEAFRSRYTPAEQQMLQDLARLFGSPR
jgi:hypothetical protein